MFEVVRNKIFKDTLLKCVDHYYSYNGDYCLEVEVIDGCYKKPIYFGFTGKIPYHIFMSCVDKLNRKESFYLAVKMYAPPDAMHSELDFMDFEILNI
jgi:hypothetical protein